MTAVLRRPVMVGAVSALLIACAPAQHATSPGVPPELKHSWEVNFNRGDTAAVAALYAPDAQLIMSGSEPVKGGRAIRATIDSLMKSGVKVHIDSSENVGAGDVAYVFGTYSIEDPSRHQEVEHGGYVEIWRRRDGQWKIAVDINASGAPPQTHVSNNGDEPNPDAVR